ncbi:hypothetical protein DWW00_22150 [Bacteroides fragilis]|uniref:Uncharacterized protein n=1 Tax=Bacteroides fragilis TaxID=817 RepID=A0A412XQF9_BACFG|nr:hypothetical protein DWW08_22745 [Bacteroides fragilis]RGV81844.1 hypothetical protein DWW00_22150 [Bacteroides fragilis]
MVSLSSLVFIKKKILFLHFINSYSYLCCITSAKDLRDVNYLLALKAPNCVFYTADIVLKELSNPIRTPILLIFLLPDHPDVIQVLCLTFFILATKIFILPAEMYILAAKTHILAAKMKFDCPFKQIFFLCLRTLGEMKSYLK